MSENNQQLAYSLKNAALQINVSTAKLRALIAAGYISTVTPPGTERPKVLHSELEAWLEAGK